jgi:hypothetical protein
MLSFVEVTSPVIQIVGEATASLKVAIIVTVEAEEIILSLSFEVNVTVGKVRSWANPNEILRKIRVKNEKSLKFLNILINVFRQSLTKT